MSLTNVEYTLKELNSRVLYNLLHLFKRRNYISDHIKIFSKYKDNVPSNTIIEITSDLPSSNNKPKTYQIYLMNAKINSVTQGTPIENFLTSDIEIKKFLIVIDITKKLFKQSREQFPNTEVFSQDELLEDIPSKDIIPKHILISSQDKEELLKHFKLSDFKKIYEFDLMSRYYGAIPNNIFRIERYNTTSGKGIDYRVVIPGKYDLMF